MSQKTATGLSKPNADALKATWEAQGATVTMKDNGDGTWDVTGTWPDAAGDGGTRA